MNPHLWAGHCFCLGVAVALGVTAASGAPIISEFMASNKTALADEDGAYSDWIEIHNPDAAAVNLAGWRLTDSASNPAKWLFPAVTLQPGDFLIVFASNKNRINPAAPLHTNFALNAGGEYLALSAPDGTISTEFTPAFPAQQDDVSYGRSFAGTTFVTSGQSARYLVPSSGTSATATWTAAGFADGSWLQGPTGLGFGLVVPGMTVKEVQTTYAMGTLSAVDAALAATPAPPTIVANTQLRQVINFLGEGSDGNFGGNLPFALPGDTHGLRATGFLSIPTTGAWTFGINSDDGSRVRVDINGDGDFADAGETVINDDTGHGPQNFFGTVASLTAGSHKFELVFFENYGGDELEFVAQSGTHSSFNAGFRLVGDTASGGLAVSTFPDGSSGGSGGVIATNVQTSMLNLRSSCYTRSSFSIANAGVLAAIDTLGFRIRYNDGFVAYLNGTKIAERNAPPAPAWDSLATGTRDDTISLVPENINATAFKSALVVGNNVLAVHGLNVALDNPSFLLLPELTGGDLQPGGPFYFLQSTPGTLNSTPASLGPVADTVFSHKRGLYTAPFTLTITTATPGATIRYTTDGSKPTATTGIAVPPPSPTTPPIASILITGTKIVRVAAFKTGYDPTNVDTNTYLFLDDVITQQPTGTPPTGWPVSPVNGQTLDYGMDPDIVNSTDPVIGGATQVKAALQAIPTLCVNLPVSSLTDPSTGIYTHASEDGFQWEREASIEMLNDPNTADHGFQENCGVRIRGGYSRTGDNPKHAFRILFRSEYGAGKLDYPIYFGDDGAVTEFDKFDIQCSQNYSWSFGGDPSNTFLRELWCRDTQLAMKQPSTHGRFVHLYLNGIYWGLYQIEERPEADFAASYFGGTDEDYDVVKVETSAGYNINPTAGDLNAWTDLWNKSRASYFINKDLSPTSPYGAMSYTQTQKNAAYFKMMGRAADGVTPTADPVLLDVDNLIDDMLIVFLSGNTDAPLSNFLGNNSPNNFYSMRDRRGGKGFIHIQHDGEHTLNAGGAAPDRVGPFNDAITGTWNTLSKSNTQFTHQDLAPNAEYRIRFADLTHKHLISPNGALSTVKNQQRMSDRAALVGSAIIAESARWGDSKTTSPLNFNHWRSAKDATLAWFTSRNGALLPQLRGAGLYPSLDAPVMSQSGGWIKSSTPLSLSSASPTILYTINGPDPRQVGGSTNPAAQTYTGGTTSQVVYVTEGAAGTAWNYQDNGSNQGTAWRNPGFAMSGWHPPAKGQFGYGEGDETTVISYGPNSANKYITTYFRTTFNVPSLANLSNLTVNVKRDDGIIIYLNGTEIVRDAMPLPPTPIDFTTTAGAITDDGQDVIPFNNLPLNLLTLGTNTLAVEIHQNSGGSTDVSFDLRLEATQSTGGSQFTLPGPGVATVRTRVRTGVDPNFTWSALNEQEFLVNTEAAAAGNLVVSEIMYNPMPPTAGEIALGFTNDEEFQYLEIQNVSEPTVDHPAQPVDLRGAYFFDGVSFVFPNLSNSSTLLPPGGRVILVENLAAFHQRYGTGFDALIGGQFSGALDKGGERLVLKSASGSVILDFTYDDAAPWPVDADGTGRSLVLTHPSGHPDLNLPTSWRPSTAIGGSPTTSDGTTYPAWKSSHGITVDAADPDSDGLSNFYEYIHGSDPAVPNTRPLLRTSVDSYSTGTPPVSNTYLTLTFERNLAADDIDCRIESCPSLLQSSWAPAAVTKVGEVAIGTSGVSSVSYRTTVPLAEAGSRQFLRMRAVQQ